MRAFCYALLIFSFFLFLPVTHSEILQPYILDSKPQVLFGDSVDLTSHYGLENYTKDYVGGFIHITYTYTHASCCVAGYPPEIYVTEVDPTTTSSWVQRSLTVPYLLGSPNSDPQDWYTYDIQFDSTGYTTVVKQEGVTETYNQHRTITGLLDTDFVSLANQYPSSPLTTYSMAFGVGALHGPPPTVDITFPIAGNTASSSAVIIFTNTSTDTPSVGECSIDNSVWVACTTGVSILADITGFNALSEGAFTLYVRDTDVLLNTGTGTSSEVGIIKDTVAPSDPVASPVAGTYVGTQTVTLSSTGSDFIRYDTATLTCSSGALYSSAISISLSQTIFAIGCDNAGNASLVASSTYIINAPASPPAPTPSSGGGNGPVWGANNPNAAPVMTVVPPSIQTPVLPTTSADNVTAPVLVVSSVKSSQTKNVLTVEHKASAKKVVAVKPKAAPLTTIKNNNSSQVASVAVADSSNWWRNLLNFLK